MIRLVPSQVPLEVSLCPGPGAPTIPKRTTLATPQEAGTLNDEPQNLPGNAPPPPPPSPPPLPTRPTPTKKMNPVLLVLIIVGGLAVVDGIGSLFASSSSNAPTAVAPLPSAIERSCSEVSSAFLSALQSGFRKTYEEASIGRSVYIQTTTTWVNGSTVFEVAVHVDSQKGVFVEDQIAVFGTNADPTTKGGGLIISANDYARSISTWGVAANPGSPVLVAFADPENVAAAQSCLE